MTVAVSVTVAVAVAGLGQELAVGVVGQVDPQRGLARAAELLAGQLVVGVVDVGRHPAQRVLDFGPVAVGVVGIGQRQPERILGR